MSKEQDEFKWDAYTVKEFFAYYNDEYHLSHFDTAIKNFVKSKQQPKSLEWEILKFKGNTISNNGLFTLGKDGTYFYESWGGTDIEGLPLDCMLNKTNPTVDIYSVRRLSDSAVFSVGDEIQYRSTNENWDIFWGGRITSFRINYRDKLLADIYSEEEYKNQTSKFLENIRHVPKPVREVLFTTEDGVKVFEGDMVYDVDKKTFESSAWYSVCNPPEKAAWYATKKYFSTKEKADDWVISNKPVLSIKEIESCWAADRSFVGCGWLLERLKELAKEKIKG